MNLPKLDNSSLWDKTYMLLKERILQREFKPNQKLSISDLAAQLGVSRTPIRDALNRLEMDGLVKTVSKVGTFVNAIEIDDLLDIMDTRLMIEQWAIEKVKILPPAELESKIAPLREILVQAAEVIEQVPLETFFKADYNLKFHLALIGLSENKRNVEIYLDLMNYHFLGVKHSLITKEMAIVGINQHYTIINSLQERRFEEVKELIKLHLADSKEALIKRIKDNGGQI